MKQEAVESFDRRLLELIQQGVPLVSAPFAELARQLGCAEQEVLDRVSTLGGDGGLIREIAGIFDASALGYQQALVALRTSPEDLDSAGALAAEHPGVSHCYGREGSYNLWLTLATSPRSRLGLESTVSIFAANGHASASMVLPSLRRYKLDTRSAILNVVPAAQQPHPAPHVDRPAPPQPSDAQLRALRTLQQDLPARSDAFAPLAKAAKMSVKELLAHAADFQAWGWMRRYAAVLHHRRAGAVANVMVVWRVADAAADAAGRKIAQLHQVSHCYLRPTGPDWPYSLYTMVHGRSRQDCAVAIDEISAVTRMTERAELWTGKEYKKSRMTLFSEAEQQWEDQQRGQ